jgi:nicotinate dehydrogenase subunit B
MTALSRREFLTAGGALVVTFALPIELRAQTSTPKDKLAQYGSVDSWLAVGADGRVTLLTGKVELGTGVETALSQLVAEELDVAVDRITVVQGDTERTPDQGYTVGSKTIHHGGPQIRQAAAEARQALLELAAARLGAPVDRLTVTDAVVSVEGDPAKRVTYAELVGGQRFNRVVAGTAGPKRPEQYRVVGTSVRRVDIPGKVTGKHTYVQDIRRPGMLHGRVVRPDGVGATLVRVDERSVAAVPGLVRVVVKDNFVGVVAEREEQAIQAGRTLKATWTPGPPLPEQKNLHADMRTGSTTDKVLVQVGDPAAALASAARTIRATYQWPFQMHGSIGPSCAVADVRADRATVWCASQGVFGLRDALAKLLGLPPANVHVLFAESAGCYGHNGVDDAAADASLLSQAVGRPVRVQWMRHDEHAWEPKGPAMEMSVRGGLDASGAVVAWDYEAWTPTHSTRPAAEPGNILAGQLTGLKPRSGFIGGDRNARHTYVFPHDRVTMHWLAQSPLRPSALRGLGAPQNSFANESFMDELAAAASADPLAFRLKHLKDPRASAVLEAVAKLSGWQARPSPNPAASGRLAAGRGVAYAQYENDTAYVAMVADVEVDRQSGGVRVKRVWVAHDCGLIVNPDGVRNQIEGNVVQTISRTLKEAVTFDRARVTSVDWQGYPLLRFTEVPEAIEIALINRPELPAVGAGEPAACPVPAIIANAVYDATGARLRAVPFTPERVKAALDTAPRT